MSTSILLRLSFIKSNMRPSVSDWLVDVAPPVCSSSLEQWLLRHRAGESVVAAPLALGGADVCSSLGELNSCRSLKGVLLKLKLV